MSTVRRICVPGLMHWLLGWPSVRGLLVANVLLFVGLCLLLGCCLRLNRLRNGCHGQRRADHGRARDRAEQVVKGSFHSGASR